MISWLIRWMCTHPSLYWETWEMKLKACIHNGCGWPPAFWSHQKYFSTIKSFHCNPVPRFCLLIFSDHFSTIPACGSSLRDYGEPVSWTRPRGLPASLSHLPPLTAPSTVILHPDFLQREKKNDWFSCFGSMYRPNIHWRADKTESVNGIFGGGRFMTRFTSGLVFQCTFHILWDIISRKEYGCCVENHSLLANNSNNNT